MIPTHYPPIQLYGELLDPADLELAYELEGLTNDRLRDLAGDIALVASKDRVVGPGSTPIMAAFTHIGFQSRFSRGEYGVYYAGLSEKTALIESLWSNQRRLEDSNEGEMLVTLRTYRANIVADLLDVSAEKTFQTNDWAPCQQFAIDRRKQNDYGLFYSSVRDPGGECVAIFRPVVIQPAIQTKTIQAVWDGKKFSRIDELKPICLTD